MESCDYVNIPMEDSESVHIGKPVSDVDISVPTADKKKKKEKSRCTCFNVCLCMTIFSFGFVFLSMSVAYMCVVGFVQEYTVEYRPNLKLETVHVPEWENERVIERAKTFVDGLELEGVAPSENFMVTEKELNGLITHSDVLSGHNFVHLEENKVSLDISIPTDSLPGGKGRQFVAHQSIQWRKDSTLSLVTSIYSEKTADYAFSKESASYDPDHAFSSEFFFRLGRSNEQRLVLDFEGGRMSPYSPEMEKKQDVLAELNESDDADTKDFLNALNGINKISLDKGQVIFHIKDGERRSLTSMDASSYLYGGMSSIARHLVGF